MASIAKRPDGQWRARYRDEADKEHAKHFPRKVDAQRWLDEVTASVVTGQYVDPKAGQMTFDKWFEQWSKRQVWAPMTAVQGDLVRRTVTFGNVPLAHLRSSHLEQWVKTMQAKKYAANTIHTRMQTVRAALKAAVRDKRLMTDPSEGVKLPRRAPRSTALQVATSEQVGKLLAASVPEMRPFIGLCAFAGLRLGEASAIKVSDVDFLRRQVRVERQVQKRRGGRSEVKPPKYESARTVYVPEELTQMVAKHVEALGLSGDDWLFEAASGGPVPPTTVNSWWMRTMKKAKLAGLTVHMLRHHYASGLIAAGCDVVTVQRALGHKSPSVTLNTYSHLWPTAEDKTRSAASGLAAAALADSLRTTEAERASDLRRSE